LFRPKSLAVLLSRYKTSCKDDDGNLTELRSVKDNTAVGISNRISVTVHKNNTESRVDQCVWQATTFHQDWRSHYIAEATRPSEDGVTDVLVTFDDGVWTHGPNADTRRLNDCLIIFYRLDNKEEETPEPETTAPSACDSRRSSSRGNTADDEDSARSGTIQRELMMLEHDSKLDVPNDKALKMEQEAEAMSHSNAAMDPCCRHYKNHPLLRWMLVPHAVQKVRLLKPDKWELRFVSGFENENEKVSCLWLCLCLCFAWWRV